MQIVKCKGCRLTSEDYPDIAKFGRCVDCEITKRTTHDDIAEATRCHGYINI